MKASKKGPPFSSSGVEARLPMPSVSRANGIRVYPSGRTTKLKPPQGPTSKKVTLPCSARRSSVARATSRNRWIRLPIWTCLSRNNGGQPVCGSGLIRAWSLISSHSTTCARVPEPLRIFLSSCSYWGRTRSQGSDASGAVSISSVMSEVRGCSEAGAACRRLSMVEQKCRNARSRRFTTRLYYRPVCPNRPGWPRSIRRHVERFIDHVMQNRRRKPQRSALRVLVEVEGDRELVAMPKYLRDRPPLGRWEPAVVLFNPLQQSIPIVQPLVHELDALQPAVREPIAHFQEGHAVDREVLSGILPEAHLLDEVAAPALDEFERGIGRKRRLQRIAVEAVVLVADLSRPARHRSDNQREKAQEARSSTRSACGSHRRDYRAFSRVKKAGAASFTASRRPRDWNRTGGTGWPAR